MAATLYGAIKALLESKNLGIAVFRDLPPPAHSRPYVVVTSDIAMRAPTLEDGTAYDVNEEIQVDLYETWRGQTERSGESPTLADSITTALQGAALMYGTPNKQIYGLIQRARRRLIDSEQRVVRHIFQFDAFRQL